jgi:hypothetical protein
MTGQIDLILAQYVVFLIVKANQVVNVLNA